MNTKWRSFRYICVCPVKRIGFMDQTGFSKPATIEQARSKIHRLVASTINGSTEFDPFNITIIIRPIKETYG